MVAKPLIVPGFFDDSSASVIVFHDSLGCVFPPLILPGFILIMLFSWWRYWELGSAGIADTAGPTLSQSRPCLHCGIVFQEDKDEGAKFLQAFF